MNFKGLFADHILPEKIHNLNVSFYLESFEESYGGTAGNIAYTLALLKENPVIMSTAGSDFEPYRAWLTSKHVDTEHIRVDEKSRTAFAMIMTDEKDNQITAFHPGAMQVPYLLEKNPMTEDDFIIVSPGNPEDMRAVPEYCRTHRISFMFDPGQQIATLSGDDLKKGMGGARVCIMNDYELAMVMKKTGWNYDDILAHTEILVTTLGERGSEIRTGKTIINTPVGKPENTTDPTGAGDAYRAGFVHGLLRGYPLETVGKLAGLVACYTVEKKGTQTHTFDPIGLRARYRENFNADLPE